MSVSEVKFIIPCPPKSDCKEKPTQRNCINCKTKLYLNSEGDVYCENFKKNQCYSKFIMDIQLSCQSCKKNEKFRSGLQFLEILKGFELGGNKQESQKFKEQLSEQLALKSIKEVYLKFPCPPSCECGDSTTQHQWVHSACKTKVYINSQGDIYCEKYKNSNKLECGPPFFIRDAKFNCEHDNKTTYSQYRAVSDFLTALSRALKAAEMNLQDDDLNLFVTYLSQQVMKKWYM